MATNSKPQASSGKRDRKGEGADSDGDPHHEAKQESRDASPPPATENMATRVRKNLTEHATHLIHTTSHKAGEVAGQAKRKAHELGTTARTAARKSPPSARRWAAAVGAGASAVIAGLWLNRRRRIRRARARSRWNPLRRKR